MKIRFFLYILVVLTSFSCVRHKHLVQFKNAGKSEALERTYTPYKLKEGDLVSVRISSLDEESVSIFNKEKGERTLSGSYNEVGLYVNSYMIDNGGNLTLPLIGELKAEGYSLEHLYDTIYSRFENYYKYFSLDVKLVGFKVSVVGEVEMSGTYEVYQDKFTVVDAIARAQGFNVYANTEEVLLIRENDGKNIIKKLNFRDKNLISDEDFYCQPGDIIYVNPLKSKAFKGNSSILQISISTLSFLLLLLYNLRI